MWEKLTEKDFESLIIEQLIENSGYIERIAKDNYDKQFALDTNLIIDFVKQSQPKKWEQLEKRHNGKVKENFIKRLTSELDKHGVLHVLRNGIKDLGVYIDLCYFKPASDMNQTLINAYECNIFSVMRQVYYQAKGTNSIDLVLFLNGIPVVTMELKNQYTGQDKEDAISQYKDSRTPRETLFAFNQRCFVHFAVDVEQVFMTTRLSGQSTRFLPFNQGYQFGAGTPPNEAGNVRTSYLWNEVLEKDSLLDIIQRFLHLQENKDGEQQLIFPRYHQLDVVRMLVHDAKENGSGHRYLIQHSAGSGKSNSIAWLAHHLSSLHDNDSNAVFDSVIVITDRRVLDKQLQDTIYQYERVDGVVKRVTQGSKQLAEAIKKGEKIIISTLQKFSQDKVLTIASKIKGKSFAIIIDEAHSSQAGKHATNLKRVLADIENMDDEDLEVALHAYEQDDALLEEKSDNEDVIIKELKAHGEQRNLSFFAFTATPKENTINIFGTPNSEGVPSPTHLYSMKQAIEEGFILDVLENYTTYDTYFNIEKTIENDPKYPKSKAKKALGKFISLHPHNLKEKTKIIVEHFRENTKHQISGKAKAMLVTSSRLHAVRYYQHIARYIKENDYDDLGILIAFSGTVEDQYTEANINKFPESELPKRFSSDEFQMLIVAEKYQTDFDEPFLHTMYVDKKLGDVKAVQTLSRLNRTTNSKDSTFVLDFVNSAEDIRKSFEPFYIETEIEEVTDPNIIYDLKVELDDYRVYFDSEVSVFGNIFFDDKAKFLMTGKLELYIAPALDRFRVIGEDEKTAFKTRLKKFTRLYSYLSHIIRLNDRALHEFNAFAKFLYTRLPKDSYSPPPYLNDEVALEKYRVQKIYEGTICIEEPSKLNSKRHGTVGKKEDEELSLAEILDDINAKYGSELSGTDKILEQIRDDMINNSDLQMHVNNPMETFKIVFDDHKWQTIITRLNQNEKFITKYIENKDYQEDIDNILLPMVYNQLNELLHNY